ncbi:glycosyltransferase [Pediococcus ethanolidurans]|uniref:glycosyltransferase n=1 Tax=Pediococcus ethanolidurans TaxID=319653 RepID=UPI00345EC603
MMNFKNVVLIVIYKMPISQSKTFKTINKQLRNEDLLILYDNSPNKELDISLKANYQYIHDNQNNGLIDAYNFSIKRAYEVGATWVTFFDQDSEIPDNFFEDTKKLENTVLQNVVSIVPKVFVKQIKISPFSSTYSLFRVKKNQIDTAINSGNTVRVDFWKQLSLEFDRNFQLDFLDYFFFKKVKDYGMKFVVSTISINHSLSSSNYKTMNFKRYNDFLKSENRFVQSYYGKWRITSYKFKLVLRVIKLLLMNGGLDKIDITLKYIFETR